MLPKIAGHPSRSTKASRTSNGPAPIAAQWGVEPELYCAAPRHVVLKDCSHYRSQAWMLNIILAAGVLWFYKYQHAIDLEQAFTTEAILLSLGLPLFTFAAAFSLLLWICSEAVVASERFTLSKGFAVRATVEQVIEKEDYEREGHIYEIEIRYVYPRNKTQVSHGSFSLRPSVARVQYGFAVGSTFTVLRHPTDPFTATPYFRLSTVEIPGAARPTVTPPANTNP